MAHTDTLQAPNGSPERKSIVTDLRRSLAWGRAAMRRGEPVRLGDLLVALGRSGGVLAVILLAAPFVSPLSLGPITAPVSMTIFLISIQIIRGREDFPIPARYLAVPLPQRLFRFMRQVIARLCRWFRWHRVAVHPHGHGPQAEEARSIRRASAVGMLVGALLLAVPVPFLPLTNTFPALAIIAFGISHLRRGRRELFWGVGLIVASVLVFVALAAAVLTLGEGALQQIRAMIPLP